MKASSLLREMDIQCGDFLYLLGTAEAGDLCYLDPPYVPVSGTAHFTDYSVGGFTEDDQRRLRDMCVELDARGVVFVQSNSDTGLVRSLYGDTCFRLETVKTLRMISSKVSSRSKGRDLLITNSQVS
jgi:DNA adenine methylase